MNGARALLAGSLLVTTACASGGAARPALRPVELRQAQTREYDAATREQMMASVTQALQDAGFQIRSGNADLGLVTAVSEHTEGKEASTALKALMWYPYLIPFRGKLPKRLHHIVDVTTTVSPVGSGFRVRIVAQRTVKHGNTVQSTDVIEVPTFYQDLFAGIDKALFLTREKI